MSTWDERSLDGGRGGTWTGASPHGGYRVLLLGTPCLLLTPPPEGGPSSSSSLLFVRIVGGAPQPLCQADHHGSALCIFLAACLCTSCHLRHHVNHKPFGRHYQPIHIHLEAGSTTMVMVLFNCCAGCGKERVLPVLGVVFFPLLSSISRMCVTPQGKQGSLFRRHLLD